MGARYRINKEIETPTLRENQQNKPIEIQFLLPNLKTARKNTTSSKQNGKS